MRWARAVGVGNSRQAFLDLFDTADAELVPIEELILEAREGLVGLFARRVFVTDPIDDCLQYREARGVGLGLGLVAPFEQCMNVGEQLRFALCRHEHVRGLKAERAWFGNNVGLGLAPGRAGSGPTAKRDRTAGRLGRPRAVMRSRRLTSFPATRRVAGWPRGELPAPASAGTLPHRFAPGCLRPLVRSDGLFDHTRQLDRFLDAVVVLEAQDRRETRLQPRGHASLQEARRVDEPAESLLPLGLGPHDRDKHRGAAQVARDLDLKHRDRADARIGDVEQDRRRDDLANCFGHPQAAVCRHRYSPIQSVRRMMSIRYASMTSSALTSSKLPILMPHSKFCGTSLTSSLNRLRASIEPL